MIFYPNTAQTLPDTQIDKMVCITQSSYNATQTFYMISLIIFNYELFFSDKSNPSKSSSSVVPTGLKSKHNRVLLREVKKIKHQLQ